MNRKWIIGSAIAAAVLAAGVAVAATSSRGPERARQYVTWKLDDALDALEANDAQRTKAHALKERLFDEGVKVHATKDEVRETLLQQFKSERPDPAVVHAMIDRMADEARALAHQAADSAIEMHQTLTPEQRAQLLERMQERRRWHRW